MAFMRTVAVERSAASLNWSCPFWSDRLYKKNNIGP